LKVCAEKRARSKRWLTIYHSQLSQIAFYGDPGKGEIASRMVPVVPPFAMYYEGKRVNSIQFHKRAAPALLAALNEIWDYCQHDQTRVDAAGVSKYAGAYNHRKVRGSDTKWSNHAYGTAIDLNAGENALGVKKGTMPQFVVDAFCRQGAMWGGWYKTRPDWMHFEFVDNGGHQPSSARPIWPVVAHLLDEEDDTAPADVLEDDPAGTDEPQNIQPVTTPARIDVETIQKRLDALGYHEVGTLDGVWGGKTAAAIAAFKNDRGLTGDPVIDRSLTDALDALPAGWTRPISVERATVTAKDIASTAPAVQQTLMQRFWAKVTGWGAVVAATFKGASDYFDGLRDKVQPVMTFFSDIPSWLWFAGIGGAALLLYLSANKATNSIVDDKRTGRLN
jgi:hypothetical protein